MTIDLDTRCSGQWIVAQQGSGKTNLLMHMIARDLQHDCSIVVLDSKGELTSAVRSLALGERLIVVDPADPVAINPFDVQSGDHVISQLAYMLSGLLETNITPKQRVFFETLVAAILEFPKPSFPLLWEVISKGPRPFSKIIDTLSEDAKSFFLIEWDNYRDTASELQWRLRGIIKKPLIGPMLSAPKTRFHIGRHMDAGRVIVIDNSQVKCGADGCGFLGRLFVAQIWAAGTARQGRPDHLKKPTFVYIDEAHLVIKKDQKIAAIVDELRSQKVGLILAHQKLAQIEDKNVLSSLENCAIKMVNVGMGELDYFSKLLDVPSERMKKLPRGHFATDIRWQGTSIMSVPKAKFPIRNMRENEEAELKARMKRLYGVERQKSPLEVDSRPATEATEVTRTATIEEPRAVSNPKPPTVAPPDDDENKPAPWGQ